MDREGPHGPKMMKCGGGEIKGWMRRGVRGEEGGGSGEGGGICTISTSKGAKAGEETGCRGERITELNVRAD